MAKEIKTRIALEGGEEVREQLKQIGEEGQKAFEQISEAAEEVADGLSEATEHLTKVEQTAHQFGSSIRTLVEDVADFARNLFEVGRAASAVGAALFEVTRQTASAGNLASEGAQSAGISAQAYGRLTYALRQSGARASETDLFFKQLNQTLQSDKPPEKAAAALESLNISVYRLANGSVDLERFINDLSDAFARMPDGARKSAIAADLFGRTGTRLIPFLNRGSAGLKTLGDEAERFGAVFSQDALRASVNFTSAFDALITAIAGVRNAFTTPFLEPFANGLRTIAGILSDFQPAINDVAKTLLTSFRSAWTVITTVAVPALSLMQAALQTVVNLMNAAFGTNLTTQHAIVVAAFIGMGLAVQRLTAIISKSVPILGTFIRLLVGVPSILTTIGSAIRVLVSTFGVLASAAQLLTVVFGGLPALVIGLAAALALFIATNQNARETIIETWNAIWSAISDGSADAYNRLTETWNSISEFFTGLWQSLVQSANDAGTFIIEALESAGEGIKQIFLSAVNSVVEYFEDLYNKIVGFFERLIDEAKKAGEAIARAFGRGGGSPGAKDGGLVQAYARGGRVRGPGTGTSDSILARLSNGEYVQRAAAVRHYGVEFMDAINSLRFPRLDEFSLGGLVDGLTRVMPVPKFADGGLVDTTLAAAGPSGRPVVLQIGGESFSLNGPEDVVERLQRFATGQAFRTPGRKPTWKRS